MRATHIAGALKRVYGLRFYVLFGRARSEEPAVS